MTESDLAALGQSGAYISQQLLRDMPDEQWSVSADGTCPICLTSLLAILAEEETAIAMDSPAHPIEELGVTRLAQTCGHIFCRKELSVFLAPRLVPGSHSTLTDPPPDSASADGCMKEYVCPHNSIWL